jgi:hypothetical protein
VAQNKDLLRLKLFEITAPFPLSESVLNAAMLHRQIKEN